MKYFNNLKKYDLCIKLNIDGKEIKQKLATLSLEAIEKYTSYCYNFEELMKILSATHPKIATYLNEYKTSSQPLYIKETNFPILYKSDLDVLLITKEELAQIYNLYFVQAHENLLASINSYEDKQEYALFIKRKKGCKNLIDLISKISEGKIKTDVFIKERLKQLNERLTQRHENINYVLTQIENNVIVKKIEPESRNDWNYKSVSATKCSLVTDRDILNGYEQQLREIRMYSPNDLNTILGLEERIRLLNIIIHLEAELEKYMGGKNIDDNFISQQKSKIDLYKSKIIDLDNGDLFFSDAGLLTRKDLH